MKRQGLPIPDWDYLGALFAREGSDEQVKFFKAFVKECNSWGTYLQVQNQLAMINHDLTKEERETLSMIGYEGD